MGCNCKLTEIIIALVVIVFALWETTYSQWIVVIAALALIVHALKCKNCGVCESHAGMSAAPAKKTTKKKKK